MLPDFWSGGEFPSKTCSCTMYNVKCTRFFLFWTINNSRKCRRFTFSPEYCSEYLKTLFRALRCFGSWTIVCGPGRHKKHLFSGYVRKGEGGQPTVRKRWLVIFYITPRTGKSSQKTQKRFFTTSLPGFINISCSREQN